MGGVNEPVFGGATIGSSSLNDMAGTEKSKEMLQLLYKCSTWLLPCSFELIMTCSSSVIKRMHNTCIGLEAKTECTSLFWLVLRSFI